MTQQVANNYFSQLPDTFDDVEDDDKKVNLPDNQTQSPPKNIKLT